MIAVHTYPIDPGLLLSLDALLQERHVSRAARRVGLTQSAMSRVLARLRAELGDPLLVRSGRTLVLSARAARLQPPLQATLLQLARVLGDQGVFESKTSRRSFRIATVDYGTVLAIVPLMRVLAREAPLVDISVEPLRGDFDEALHSGALDLVLAPRRKSSVGLVWTKLISERFVSVVRKDHPKLRRPLDLDLFCALSHVVVVPEQRAGNPIDERLAAHGRKRHIALRVASFLAAPLVVAESDLLLTTPESVARRFAAGFGLRVCTPPLELESLGLSLAFHERQRSDPGHAFLRAAIVKAVQPRGRTSA
jgi:DNA-binding transcriptional LysR family regulator